MADERNDAPPPAAYQPAVDQVMSAGAKQGPNLTHAAPNLQATPNSLIAGSMATVDGPGGVVNTSNANIAGLVTPSGGPAPAANDPSISSVELQGGGAGVGAAAVADKHEGDAVPHAGGSATDVETSEHNMAVGPAETEEEIEHEHQEENKDGGQH